MELAWNNRTQFVQAGRFTAPAAMHPGQPVIVTYRSPFFGHRFATKVVVALSDKPPRRPKKCAAFPTGCVATFSQLHHALRMNGTVLLT
jgi:hypothetical protein